MPNKKQPGVDYQIDPKAPDNVHDSHAAGKKGKATSSDPQTPVPRGDKGDPTRDTWKVINKDKVVTTKEEMPSPQQQEKQKPK
jgi:hypothetical protein